MYVELGNAAPKEGIKSECDPEHFSRDELVEKAEAKGIEVDSKANKQQLAALISAVPTFNKLDGKRVTRVDFPEDMSVAEAVETIIKPVKGIWAQHSDEAPDWVESDSDMLAQLLADHFDCTVGAPNDLEDAYYTVNGPPGVGPDGGAE